MSDTFADILASEPPGDDSGRGKTLAVSLDRLCQELASLLTASGCSVDVAERCLARLAFRVRDRIAAVNTSAGSASAEALSMKPPPEVVEWARQHINEEEVIAGIRNIREGRGAELGEFIQELEEAAGSDDRTDR